MSYLAASTKHIVKFTLFAGLIGSLSIQNTMAAGDSDSFWHDKETTLSKAERAAVEDAACPPIADNLENDLSDENWNPKFIKPKNRFSIQSDQHSEGAKALAVALHAGDKPNASGKHKHELRIANDKRCNFGVDVWYSFSFHIDGTFPNKGSTRWVIGQWKEESGASPFLAQRFDNGVFHISIQRNAQREIIATAPGDFDSQFTFLSKSFSDFKKQIGTAKKLDRREIATEIQKLGASAYDLKSFRKAITEQDISRFPFVSRPEDYSKIPDVRVETSQNPFLPNPSFQWVDMRYRVKGDRHGNGIIEVWANNVFIVRVTGKIGSDDFDGPTQYFKFGHYRDVDASFEKSNVYLDKFKRGRTRSEVD